MSRIRANQITNQSADGAPTVQNGLIISGVTTSTTFVGALTGTASNASGATGDFSIADKIVHTGDTNTAIRFPADDTISFETAGSERLRIKSNGKVGVGTDGPSQQFTSYADSGYPILANSSSNGIGLGGNGVIVFGNKDLASYAAGAIDATDFAIKISGTERLRITSDGNVNINSSALSSPYSSFRHISINNNLILNAQNSAGGFAGMQNNAYLNSSGAWVRVNNDHATSIGTDDGNFYFRNAGAGTGTISWNNLFRITSSGALGTNSTVRSANGGLDLCSQGATNLGTLTLGAGGGQNGQSRNNNQENQYRIMMPTYANPSLMVTQLYGVSGSGGHEINYGGYTGWAYSVNTHKFYTAANATTGAGTERLRITKDGYIKIGESNSGNVAFSLVTNGSGMLLSKATTGNPSNGQTLGDIGFNAYSDSQTTSSADALIRGQAAGNFSGSSAPTDLLFFTKPASTGPGSAPTERMRINKDGIVTTPQQPMASTTCATQGTGYLGHSATLTNQGGHFNTSNSRFVCPVSGYYFVSIMVMTNNSNDTLDIELRKNGSNPSNILVPYQAATGGQYNQVSGACIIDCAANDYLQFHVNNGSIYGGRHSAQCFALLG